LPQTLNVSVAGAAGHAILAACPQVAASTGSACHSQTHSPSPVPMEMGLGAARGLTAVRLTLGRTTTESDVLVAAEALARAVRAVDRAAGDPPAGGQTAR
jgi:cysteine desulfurase